jgi:hypothetical protein
MKMIQKIPANIVIPETAYYKLRAELLIESLQHYIDLATQARRDENYLEIVYLSWFIWQMPSIIEVLQKEIRPMMQIDPERKKHEKYFDDQICRLKQNDLYKLFKELRNILQHHNPIDIMIMPSLTIWIHQHIRTVNFSISLNFLSIVAGHFGKDIKRKLESFQKSYRNRDLLELSQLLLKHIIETSNGLIEKFWIKFIDGQPSEKSINVWLYVRWDFRNSLWKKAIQHTKDKEKS